MGTYKTRLMSDSCVASRFKNQARFVILRSVPESGGGGGVYRYLSVFTLKGLHKIGERFNRA